MIVVTETPGSVVLLGCHDADGMEQMCMANFISFIAAAFTQISFCHSSHDSDTLYQLARIQLDSTEVDMNP